MGENKKIGYLTVKNTNGKEYLVLRVSKRVRKNGKSIVEKKQLYSFGRLENSLEKMYLIRDCKIDFPDKLKSHGYTLDDIDEWILTLETKITKNGRKMKSLSNI